MDIKPGMFVRFKRDKIVLATTTVFCWTSTYVGTRYHQGELARVEYIDGDNLVVTPQLRDIPSIEVKPNEVVVVKPVKDGASQ